MISIITFKGRPQPNKYLDELVIYSGISFFFFLLNYKKNILLNFILYIKYIKYSELPKVSKIPLSFQKESKNILAKIVKVLFKKYS